MNNDFESSLRETLNNAVPAAPPSPDRAEGARMKAKRTGRTRNAVVASAAAALAVAAIAIVPGLLNDKSTSAQRGPQVASPGASPYDGFQCPTGADPASTEPITKIDRGALRARICPAGGPELQWQAPGDALTSPTDLDLLVDQINGLESARPDLACTMELGPAYTLTFEYADGRLATIAGQNYGCQAVTLGDKQLVGASQISKDYFDSLERQRATMTPSQPVPDPGCASNGYGQPTTLMPAPTNPGFVKVVGCEYLSSDSSLVGGGPLSDADVVSLNSALVRSALADPAQAIDCMASDRTLRLVGVNEWGDMISISESGIGCWSVGDSIVSLGPELERAIDKAVED